ncbi:hypothetical protein Tco_0654553 [Tanacetum coccineum]|uniref:Uncharacterized protein n=1 Tax=Tanacetum coccineum TaxID=301880 RepID=A0ABQ4X3N8_9ASTR
MEPFEDLINSDPFEDRASPVVTADLEIRAGPLGSPDTSNYYGGFEFSEEDPSGDDSSNASAGTNESPPAQSVPVSDPQSPPALSAPIAPYRDRVTATTPPSPSPVPSPLSPLSSSSSPPSPARSEPSCKRSRPSPSPSAGPSRKRRRSPSPAALTSAELALAAPALPAIRIDLLPPRKRFGAIKMIETADKEIELLSARLVAAEIQIAAHQSEEIGRDIKKVGYRSRLQRIEDTLQIER